MAGAYEDFEDGRVKHLEMIQAVVDRLAGNSFLLRGWALTICAAFFGFALRDSDARLAIIGLFPVVLFCGLDAYFLQAERLFRVLHEEVRQPESGIEPFYLNATSKPFRDRMAAKGRDISWRSTLKRPVLLAYYGGLVIIGIATAVVAC